MATRRRLIVLLATCLVTLAGGAVDAWVYLGHGHVFANAQSGNIVLMGIALAQDDFKGAAAHLPSLAAFVAGLLASRLAGRGLKSIGLNSRVARLGVESLLLLALALVADRLSNSIVTSCVGFIAGVQITSLSHFGTWTFNTGMTTGNLRAAATAASNALSGTPEEWPRALSMAVLSAAFAAGAVIGACLTPRFGELTLLPVAGSVALAAILTAWERDPLPDWRDLD